MAELLLINPNTGNPYLTASKKIPKNAKAEDYLNILILFVDYKDDAGVVNTKRLNSDRRVIVKKLYQTYPFNVYLDKVNVFTPNNQPDLGVIYSDQKFDSGGFAFKKSIKDTVSQYSYQSFIQLGNVWEWESPYGKKRSEACIGIISGNTSQQKGGFNALFRPSGGWSAGAESQLIGSFLVSQFLKFSGIGGQKLRETGLSNTFMHELGHALTLSDEYEFKIDADNNGVWTGYSIGFPQTANVISRNDLWKTTGPFNLAEIIIEGIFPAAINIDNTKIPWEIMLGEFQGSSASQKSTLLNLHRHDSRNISEVPCRSMSKSNGQNYTYNHTHGWCEKSARFQISSTTTKATATLPIGLYEGGDTKSFDVFRAQETCRMRGNAEKNISYCWVCQKWIRYRISAPFAQRTVPAFKKWLENDIVLQLQLFRRGFL